MLLGAATRIWLEGALCHENSKILNVWTGQKYGGSEEATVRVWIGAGQTQRSGPLSSRIVDNHLLFSQMGSTLRVLHRFPSISV